MSPRLRAGAVLAALALLVPVGPARAETLEDLGEPTPQMLADSVHVWDPSRSVSPIARAVSRE